MYAEAVPLFYGGDHFVLNRIAGFNHFVRGLVVDREAHVARLTIDCESWTEVEVTKLTGTVKILLNKGKGLKSVTVRARNYSWWSDGKGPEALQGMQKLCKFPSAVERVEVVGDCPMIQAHIFAQVEWIRSERQLPRRQRR